MIIEFYLMYNLAAPRKYFAYFTHYRMPVAFFKYDKTFLIKRPAEYWGHSFIINKQLV